MGKSLEDCSQTARTGNPPWQHKTRVPTSSTLIFRDALLASSSASLIAPVFLSRSAGLNSIGRLDSASEPPLSTSGLFIFFGVTSPLEPKPFFPFLACKPDLWLIFGVGMNPVAPMRRHKKNRARIEEYL